MDINLGKVWINAIKMSIIMGIETDSTTYETPSWDNIGAQAQ